MVTQSGVGGEAGGGGGAHYEGLIDDLEKVQKLGL